MTKTDSLANLWRKSEKKNRNVVADNALSLYKASKKVALGAVGNYTLSPVIKTTQRLRDGDKEGGQHHFSSTATLSGHGVQTIEVL